jgi:hypothetical protein
VGVVLAAVVVLGLLGVAISKKESGVPVRVVRFTDRDITRRMWRHGTPTPETFHVRRDYSGTRIFIVASDIDSGTNRLDVVGATNWTQHTVPACVVFVDRAERVVACYDDLKKGVHFATGETLSLPPFSFFDVDPAGEFFVVGESNFVARVGSIETPTTAATVSTNLLASRIFYGRGCLFVCGWSRQQVKRGTSPVIVPMCLKLSVDRDQFRPIHEYSFQGMGAIIDVDPYGVSALLEGSSDLFPRLYKVNLATGRRTSVGISKQWAFFMSSGWKGLGDP